MRRTPIPGWQNSATFDTCTGILGVEETFDGEIEQQEMQHVPLPHYEPWQECGLQTCRLRDSASS